MEPSWAITPEKIETVIQRIIDVSNPQKIILFGSYIQGKMHVNSDLDILVVTGDEIVSPRKESVRIRRALRGIIMSMDILVVPESQFEELVNSPGLIYREAVKTGKTVYEAA